MKKVHIYVHSSKESAYDAAKKAGIKGEALEAAKYLGYEHKLTFDVDETGNGILIAVDDRKLEAKNAKK